MSDDNEGMKELYAIIQSTGLLPEMQALLMRFANAGYAIGMADGARLTKEAIDATFRGESFRAPSPPEPPPIPSAATNVIRFRGRASSRRRGR